VAAHAHQNSCDCCQWLLSGAQSRRHNKNPPQTFFERNCKTVQCGRVRAAVVTKQTSALTAKAITNSDVVKFIDNFFHRLAWKNEFFGNLQGLVNRYYFNGFSVLRLPGGYGAIYGGSTIKQRRNRNQVH
jgi:hypothetical protein